MQFNAQIRRGEIRMGFVRPLHQTDARRVSMLRKVFIQPCIKILFRLVESIKIKVIEVYSRNRVNFNQRICRAFYRPGITRGAEQAANQCGFAGAQITFKPNDATRTNRCGQGPPQIKRRGFVR